ncbi:MAG: hypothetical protein JNK93_19670 [Planctomycetia bacterium]|nr:hypothetical protein [Planctomycetia bacterium]
MPKSVSALAKNALAAGKGAMEEVRIHVFEDDEEAHDEEAVEKLHADFAKQFDKAVATLSKEYGKPTRTGESEYHSIPLNGVFRFAIWKVGKLDLYVAAAHEDTEVPIVFMLGTAE